MSFTTDWIADIPDMIWMPAKHWNDTPEFAVEPDLLVIHSGSKHPNVAEYEVKTGQVEYVDLKTGEKHIVLTCYHVAWSITHGCFVQQVKLTCEGWHAGGSFWKNPATGKKVGRTNAHSIGWAFPGPPAKVRPAVMLGTFVTDVVKLVAARPSLKWWTRHQDIDTGKRDPGPGIPLDILDGILEYAP